MHIAQLTDIHLSASGECPHDIDVRANFLKAIQAINELDPDLLVISGDLCYDVGVEAIYGWIKEQLANLKYPYRVIPGNHDNANQMIECFGLQKQSTDGQLFYALTDYPQPILLLDTSDYTLPDLQVRWLKEKLTTLNGPICIFMHHPPSKMGVPYMDEQHFLKNMDEVLELFLGYQDPVSIFTGHYHVDKSLRVKNVDIHITPSTFFQIDWKKAGFQVDHYHCGFRSIFLEEDQILHSVIYYS